MAARVRQAKQAAQRRTEAEAYLANPDAGFWAARDSLPPPPGMIAAQRASQQNMAQAAAGGGQGVSVPASRSATHYFSGNGGGSSGGGKRGGDVLLLTLHQPSTLAASGFEGGDGGNPQTVTKSVMSGWTLATVKLHI